MFWKVKYRMVSIYGSTEVRTSVIEADTMESAMGAVIEDEVDQDVNSDVRPDFICINPTSVKVITARTKWGLTR